jgi:hypothetical protein
MMNAAGYLWSLLRLISMAAILLLPNLVTANPWIGELKRCLQNFGGIEWKLPYQPPVTIHSCASQAVSFNADTEAIAGRHSLELIGKLTLGLDMGNLSSGEMIAAVHNAMYIHFDALFRHHGYRQIGLGHGDAQTRRDLRALIMLYGGKASKEDIDAFNLAEAKKPPIPYVNLARYVQTIAGYDMALTYKLNSANTWLIILEPAQTAVNTPAGATQ